MIKLQRKLPRNVYLACSGGVDSMAALDFLRRNHHVVVLHMNHGTAHGERAMKFLTTYCQQHSIDFHSSVITETIPPGPSKEEWWRERRYAFLDRFQSAPVITCHHLDDCVETWIWSSLHGTGKIIPYRRGNVIRPFRLTRKRDLELWCNIHNVPWIEDDSNTDLCYTRNYIRHEMMLHVLKVNPGIHKTIAKKVNEDHDDDS
jgi:tRNA(Ile)-lysidine synthase